MNLTIHNLVSGRFSILIKSNTDLSKNMAFFLVGLMITAIKSVLQPTIPKRRPSMAAEMNSLVLPTHLCRRPSLIAEDYQHLRRPKDARPIVEIRRRSTENLCDGKVTFTTTAECASPPTSDGKIKGLLLQQHQIVPPVLSEHKSLALASESTYSQNGDAQHGNEAIPD